MSTPAAALVRAEFLNTGGEHVHDSSISSFGLHIPGEVRTVRWA